MEMFASRGDGCAKSSGGTWGRGTGEDAREFEPGAEAKWGKDLPRGLSFASKRHKKRKSFYRDTTTRRLTDCKKQDRKKGRPFMLVAEKGGADK